MPVNTSTWAGRIIEIGTGQHTDTGSVYSFGSNNNNELCLGSRYEGLSTVSTPTQISFTYAYPIQHMSIGTYSKFLASDGSIQVCGEIGGTIGDFNITTTEQLYYDLSNYNCSEDYVECDNTTMSVLSYDLFNNQTNITKRMCCNATMIETLQEKLYINHTVTTYNISLSSPQIVNSWKKVASKIYVSKFNKFSSVIDTSGNLYWMGYVFSGDESVLSLNYTLTKVTGIGSNVVEKVAIGSSSLLLKVDKGIYTVGENSFGQLNSTLRRTAVPILVTADDLSGDPDDIAWK
ncbi:predicted protein [Naegleria gruberi]|uniref:Predicted protein n=1 Tax=Naegleria gruberi TaxID=5762 RepID=D2UXG7_NAEGR|nr:uncharacterized protein NAEGRDRAFT_61116 [Naegleria gruberi]EFC50631.1 predicted protein [Naegleria gruberi]|eukprot:XP_002683375.1 predicted protein [Naegleria gruberi strain NEG-M]